MDSSIPREDRLVWPVDEIGAPGYHSYLLGAPEELLARDPGLVKDFLVATEAGYRAVAADPLIALPIYERVTPYFPTALFERSLPLIASTWVHEGLWGVQRRELMETYALWLADQGILARRDQWPQAYTNDFLPPVGGRP